LDVLPDDVFIDADGVHEVTSGPEVLLGDSAFPGEHIVGSDGALAFEEAHDGSDRMLGWDLENHVHVIGAGIAFQNFHFFLFCQFSDDLANLDSDGTVQNFPAVLWYNDHVVFAVPYHMTL